MVRGARLYLLVATVCVTTVSLPGAYSLGNQIKKFIYNNNGFGTYSFEFETSDGTHRREDGGVVSETEGLVVRGEYGYIDPSGRYYAVRYIADANGFHPQSNEMDTRFNDRRII